MKFYEKVMVIFFATLFIMHCCWGEGSPRSRTSFNNGWRFARFSGNAQEQPMNPAFDDAKWRELNLPHDWAIEGPFRPDLDHATGLLPWKAIGWYRKAFVLPESDRGQKVFLDFDGAMAHAKVFLNGKAVGDWPYGYTSFRVDLTPALEFGATNVLAVRLDTVHWGSRWYPGGGIYRNTWLVKTAPVHVAQWGVQVRTPKVSKQSATVAFEVTVKNESKQPAKIEVAGRVLGKKGASLRMKQAMLAPGESRTLQLSTILHKPRLWNLSDPQLYRAEVLLRSNGELVDRYPVSFGLRTLKFTPRDGFFLNGKRVEIKGVCNHHDLGPLGAAVNRRALERQLEILKEMGCNAIRTSHNPPTPELLELCDRMGFLLMDEAFDCWKRGKRPFDYGDLFEEWHKKDLLALIRRDQNHPSVFMWSIGNEVPDQLNAEMAKGLRDIVHAEDPSRPVVVCCNNGKAGLSPTAEAVDVMGYNYNLGNYANFFNRAENKEKPLIASETSSCISSRGEYFFPPEKNKRADFQITSYDLDYPGWGCTPDKQFEMLARYPAVLGEFVWTGFDYLGEPTPYNNDATVLLNFSSPEEREKQQKKLAEMGKIQVPSRSSYFGIIDLCGFPKDRFYNYQAHWRPDFPMAHILPHWNWPNRVGQLTPVYVYTSGDEAELFLNGKSQGRKEKGEYEYRLRWNNVYYAPGELRVVAYKNGKKWAEETVQTTGKPAALQLTADRQVIHADGKDLSFVTLRVLDAKGRMVPTADIPIHFSLEGSGKIIATGSGNAASHESFQSPDRTSFNGLALAIIQAEADAPGTLVLHAEAKGMRPAKIKIQTR